MFSKIIPSLELDITDLLLDSKLWGEAARHTLVLTCSGVDFCGAVLCQTGDGRGSVSM